VKNGVGLIELKNLFKNLRETKKLVSMDFVEYNPEKGDDSEVVIELLKTLFF
jgi:arginase family enzyme